MREAAGERAHGSHALGEDELRLEPGLLFLGGAPGAGVAQYEERARHLAGTVAERHRGIEDGALGSALRHQHRVHAWAARRRLSPQGAADEVLERASILDAVAEAHRGAERVAQIVRGLKVFSRGLDERRQPLSIARVADQVLHLLANELRHRARVVRDFHEAPEVEASEAHLGQVLVNLVLNAAQSIPEGEADKNQVTVSVRRGEAGDVVLEVRDTGAGMRPEVLARVFDPFFTTRPVGSGSGLGLSICHGIVTSLGGHIEAESVLGRGSAFRVTLPAAKSEMRVQQRTPPPSGTRRGRILLVEDDPLVARAVRRTLSRDHDVVFVESGRAALQAIAKEKFDLVISDLMMPEMSGMDLHAELSRTHPDIASRMVFFSGGAFTTAAREFLRRVPNVQVEKPFDPAQLRELIARLLSP